MIPYNPRPLVLEPQWTPLFLANDQAYILEGNMAVLAPPQVWQQCSCLLSLLIIFFLLLIILFLLLIILFLLLIILFLLFLLPLPQAIQAALAETPLGPMASSIPTYGPEAANGRL